MRPHQKVVMVEQYGAGTFMTPADLEEGVESERTLAVVKHVLVEPPQGQNGPYLEERAHLGGCWPAAAEMPARRWPGWGPGGVARTRRCWHALVGGACLWGGIGRRSGERCPPLPGRRCCRCCG
jgi:hypothetical protein